MARRFRAAAAPPTAPSLAIDRCRARPAAGGAELNSPLMNCEAGLLLNCENPTPGSHFSGEFTVE